MWKRLPRRWKPADTDALIANRPYGDAYMFAQIKHIASISQNYAAAGKFYEAVFGMRTSSQGKSHLAVTVGDGYSRL